MSHYITILPYIPADGYSLFQQTRDCPTQIGYLPNHICEVPILLNGEGKRQFAVAPSLHCFITELEHMVASLKFPTTVVTQVFGDYVSSSQIVLFCEDIPACSPRKVLYFVRGLHSPNLFPNELHFQII